MRTIFVVIVLTLCYIILSGTLTHGMNSTEAIGSTFSAGAGNESSHDYSALGETPAELNLLKNPGFEDKLTSWNTSEGTASYTADLNNRHSGLYSANGIETSTSSLGRLYQNVTSLVVPGERYKIGGWIKTRNVVGAVVIGLDYVLANGWTPVGGVVKEIGYVSGNCDWTYYESNLFGLPPMPLGCVALWFLVDFNNGSGTAYIDDVALVHVDIVVPDDYSNIQAAVNAAYDRDCILVRAATYYETLSITKPLSLLGENEKTTVIDGGGLGDVVLIYASNVTVCHFTIRNSGIASSGAYGGIGIYGADNVTIGFNNLVNNDDGVWLYDSSYDLFSNNNISFNVKAGVYTRYSTFNDFTENTVSNNAWGIVLRTATSRALIANNVVDSNAYIGIQVGPESDTNNVTGNMVTNNDYGVAISYTGHNIFAGNNVSQSKYDGITLDSTIDNLISKNVVSSNKGSGIYLYGSSNNTIAGNDILRNGGPALYAAGICIESSDYNTFYHNNLVGNIHTHVNIITFGSANTWQNGYPSGGNYWSDYFDVDEKRGPNQDQPGSDRIWDHPYIIDGNNQDDLPREDPWIPWGDWEHYHDYEEIVDTLFYLNNTYPNIVDLFSIGKTWQNRDIYCIRLTNESVTQTKPKLLFIGNHHGRELISSELALYCAVNATAGFGVNATMTYMLNFSEIYIIPALNPDGMSCVAKNEWHRKNAHPIDEDNDTRLDEDPPEDEDGDGYIEDLIRWDGSQWVFVRWEGTDNDSDGLPNEDWIGGVDLNRNYGYEWNASCYSGSTDPWAEDYRGTAPFSELETQALRDFALSQRFKYAVSFHSGSERIVYPWGYTDSIAPHAQVFENIAQGLSTLVSVPYQQSGQWYTTSGVWDDWIYGAASALPFTCEIYTNSSAWQYELGPEPDTLWERGIFQWANPDPGDIGAVVQRWMPAFINITRRAIRIVGDVNGDEKVDVKDIYRIAKAYGSYPEHSRWDAICDLNLDFKVDIKDYYPACKNYGKWTP